MKTNIEQLEEELKGCLKARDLAPEDTIQLDIDDYIYVVFTITESFEDTGGSYDYGPKEIVVTSNTTVEYIEKYNEYEEDVVTPEEDKLIRSYIETK